MADIAQVCGVIDALSNLQQQIINAINSKFAALRRLAELLEQLSDLTGFIPDISKLIPISQIDFLAYEQLRAACPFLNLPSADTGLNELRAQVNAAYGKLLSQLNLHPLGRLSKLQEKLDSYQHRFNVAALGGTDFMQCLQAACQAAVKVDGTVSNLSNTSAEKVAKSAQTYLKNMVTDQGRILSGAAQAKVDDFNGVKSGVKSLMDVPAVDLPKLSTK